MLGRLEMDVDSCIKWYIHLCELVFSNKKLSPIDLMTNIRARFDSNKLEDAIKKVIVQHGAAEEELLKKPENSCKVYVHTCWSCLLYSYSNSFVCATSGNTATPVLFRSYYSKRGTSSLYHQTKIWEAARATSAAPTLFAPISIGSVGRTFGDGATGANNPIDEMWKEAIDICDGESLIENLACIVSIGTGTPNLKKFGNSATQVMNSIVRIATETEETANTFNHSHPELNKGNQRYFRFNVPGALAEIGLHEASEAGTIEDMTDVYLKDENTHKQIQQCAKIVAESNSGTDQCESSLFSAGLDFVTYSSSTSNEYFLRRAHASNDRCCVIIDRQQDISTTRMADSPITKQYVFTFFSTNMH
jgi:hypothetical protein